MAINKIKLEYIFLGIILLFSFLIYSWRLSLVPSSVYVDEAVAAYDSYSLINTSSDHFGQPHPIAFRFFGAYTPGLFVYLNTLPVKLFGLNDSSIRIISVISTIIELLFIYLIFIQLDRKSKMSSRLLALLFISICPWVVFNARLGYEVTLAQAIFTISIYFLLRSQDLPKYLIPAALFLSISIHSAHTQKILSPLLIIISFILLKLWKYPKNILFWSIFIFLLIQLPNIYLATTNSFWVKSDRLGKTPVEFVNNISYQFFQNISPKTWFNQSPDIDLQHQIPQTGLFYSWLFIPFTIGLINILLNIKLKSSRIILALAVISLIPGTLSGRFMSTQRLLSLLLPFSIIIWQGFKVIEEKINVKYFLLLLTPIFFYSLLMLWRSYFILLPTINASSWNYGVSQVVNYMQKNPQYHYIVDNSRNPRQYILYLYYLKYDPIKFHREIGEYWHINYYQNTNYITNVSFSNIEVRPFDFKDLQNTNNVIVGDQLTLSSQQIKDYCLEVIDTVEFPNHQIAYNLYQPTKCSKNKK